MENFDEAAAVPEGQPVQLCLDDDAQNYLYQAARWSTLLAIIGFIFIAFLVLLFLALFLGGVLSFVTRISPYMRGVPLAGISMAYLIMAAVYFFPTYYLYRFASNAKEGLKHNNSQQLSAGISNLKSFFKFWGILTLIVIVFYVLLFAFILIGGIGMMHQLS